MEGPRRSRCDRAPPTDLCPSLADDLLARFMFIRHFQLPRASLQMFCGVPLVLALVPLPRADAQTLTGTVRTRDDLRPATGAIVIISDSTNRPVGGDVADSLGRFRITAPRAGRYTVRVERIGLRAVTAPSIALASGQTVELPIDVATDPVALRRVRIDADSRCDVRPREGTPGELAAWLWEEARKALTATSVADAKRTTPIVITDVISWRDPSTGRVLREDRLPDTRVVGRPFASLPPESLAVHGYVEQRGDSTVYAAPDAATLLDPRFLDQHCLSARAARRDQPGLVGLAFAPVRGTSRSDVRGVLWLDARTFELRHLDFGYTAPESLSNAAYGGRVDFARMRDGQWIVRRWTLRVPGSLAAARGRATPVVREEVQELARRSLESLGIESPMPVVVAPSAESLARSACAGATTDSTGVVTGVARDGATGVPLAGAEVQAQWLGFLPSGSAMTRTEPISLLVRTDREGRYALCAVPGGALVTLVGRFGDRIHSAPTLVRALRGAVASTDLELRAP
jgi:hypothetical protein